MEEIRKLAKNMKQKEKQELRGRVNLQRKDFIPCGHLEERMQERTITLDMIQLALTKYQLIEYHYKHSHRVLLRSRDVFILEGRKQNVCIVVNLDNNEIVSAYSNPQYYTHEYMDESKYNYTNTLNIVDCMIGSKGGARALSN